MADSSTESEGDDVIRLSLRKPKAWKWSLTTSVSSPGVVVPVIQLWDSEQGSILVDTGSNPKAVKKRSKTVSFERHVSKQSDKCLSRSKSDNAKRVSWGENRPLQQSDEPVKRRDNDETERHIVYRSLEKKHERKEEPSRSLSLSSKDSWNVRFAKPNDYVVPRIPVSVARKVSLTTTTSSAIPEEAFGSNTKARPSSGIPRFTKSNVDATTTRKDKDTLQNDKLPHRNNIIVLRNDILPGRNKATALNDRKAKNNESVVPSGRSVKQNKPNDPNGPRFLKQDNVSDINVSKASCSSGLKKPSPVRRPCQEKVVKITPTKRAESSPEKVNNTPKKRAESSPEKVNNTLKKRAESSPEKVNNTPTKRAESSLEKVNNTLKKRAELSPEKVNNTLTKRAESSPEKVNKPGVINKQRKVEMELCFSGPNRHRFDVRRTRSANDKALGKQSSQQNRESSAEKTTSKIPTSSQLGKPKVTRYPVNRNADCPSDQRKPNTCVSPIKDCNSNKNNNINKCSNKKIETAQQNSKPDLVNKSRIPSLCGGPKPTNSGKDVRDNAAKRDSIRARRLRAECRHRIEKQYCSSSSDTETNQTHMDCQRRKRRSLNIKGDRLVAINGQCVRCPEEAGELLRESGDVVRLQLVRNGVGSQSLPRHGVKVELPEDTDSEMGSNMSRHSGKGLTGRRSQSSGNLCNGKIIGSNVARYFSPCSRVENSVGPRDRYKFCGSLPNHLDAKDPVEVDEISDDPSSFKNNNNVATLNNHHHPLKNDLVELRLHPLVSGSVHHHVHQDSATNDQGYASERSPEEELPPDLPAPIVSGTCPLHHRTGKAQYPFINKHSTFTVTLVKGSRGLGLSVTGGVDTNEQWPGLIRIKRLFPHQPAWESGQLAQGDILLVANNIPLTGLTNYEALEVLRTTPTDVVLTVCRPPPELQVLNTPAPTAPAPVPPRRDTQSSTSSLLLPLKRETYGEFDITLSKVNGSLGFTLRKEDESVLGHYVRALVREPALSDSRIKPGDKIVAVNGVDLSPMSHEEAVMFLRQCGQEVHLRLFRDPAQTPVAALSPTEGHRTFKPILRKEAQDMLSDLAVKKSMSPDDSTGSSTLSRLGRSSSPRKRRLTKMPSPDSQINGTTHLPWSNEVLNQVIPGWDNERPQRPDFLNLNAERKPHFQFVAAPYTVHEETGGSCEELDSSSHVHDKENENADDFGVGPLPSEPVSMPPLSSNSTASLAGFSYRNPAYRSANPATNTKSKSSLSEELPDSRCSDNDLPVGNTVEGSKGLLKWKGVVFTPEDGENSNNSPEDSISQITETDEAGSQSEGVGQVLVVELNRGWNSRLGFSLQQVGRNSVISAIYPDSVASRDGRLKSGDQLIMVNDESVEGMTTSEVIDLLRKIRGSICITVWRKQS